MNRSRSLCSRLLSPGLAVGLFVLLGLTASPARAGDFMDTRITFFFQDDDFLHDAGETLPNSPTAGFAVRKGRVFFFENHNRKDRGDETLTHLVSYKSVAGFIPNLTTEAALVLRLNIDSIYEGNFTAQRGGLRDEGTYINLRYDLNPANKEKVELTLFPFSTERFQLGYSYRMAWGGSNIFGTYRKGPAPGLKLTYTSGPSYAFVGAKTATIQRFAPMEDTELNDELDTFYAGLLGGGYEVLPELLLEVNGGVFQRGTIPNLAVRGEALTAWGASLQAVYHEGIPVGRSADFGLSRTDPNRVPTPKTPADARPFGYSVAVEGTLLQHVLEDPEHSGGTPAQNALAAALNVLVQNKGLLVFADFVYRDLPFILFNVPGYHPYQTFLEQESASPEFWAALGAEYTFTKRHLTPGITFGLQVPATVETVPNEGSNAPTDSTGSRTVVVRSEGEQSILPAGEKAVPIFGAKANLRWDVSEMVSIIGELFFSLDNNRTTFQDDTTGISTRKFIDPYLFGGSIMAQARY